MSTNDDIQSTETVASRKFAAAQLRQARKAARDPRNRLLSDSSDEAPKGILKNARIPTKRSVSECVDDLSQIMADLDLNIHDLPKATHKFGCQHQYFDEHEEDEDDNDVSDDDDDDDDHVDHNERENIGSGDSNLKSKICDCNTGSGDSDSADRPKKSVRFDDRVYETFFFASRLYDKRYFSKYRFSSRHHPPTNQNGKKKGRSKSESKDDFCSSTLSLKVDNSCNKPTKSQRAKQSKKDKKKRLNKKDDATDTGSDDQGYSSSMHSFSD